MRKYTIVLFFWLLGWSLPVFAADEAVFWSLERNGTQAGYLLGTIHSEDPRVLEFTEEFLQTLTSCDTYAMELVPDLVTMRKLLAFMQLPEGKSLANEIGAQRYARVVDAFKVYGVSPEQANRMKPWAAMMTLSVPPPRSGLFLDFSLSLRASGAGLDVVGLETLEEQLAFLENLTHEQQLDLLDQAVDEVDQVGPVHEAMVTTYLQGSLVVLERQAHEQMDSLDADTRRYFIEKGVDVRNHRMLANAIALLDGKQVLIAVGALHLPGNEGLINLFREQGYSVKPMPSPFVSAIGEQ